MKFGYVILYVADVSAAIDFYVTAFDLTERFVDESGQYGELDTGTTVLAFANHELSAQNLPDDYQRLDPASKPLGFEVAFVTDDVAAALDRAVEAGAMVITEPTSKPWGQIVAYVRSPEGTLVELCTPIGE